MYIHIHTCVTSVYLIIYRSEGGGGLNSYQTTDTGTWKHFKSTFTHRSVICHYSVLVMELIWARGLGLSGNYDASSLFALFRHWQTSAVINMLQAPTPRQSPRRFGAPMKDKRACDTLRCSTLNKHIRNIARIMLQAPIPRVVPPEVAAPSCLQCSLLARLQSDSLAILWKTRELATSWVFAMSTPISISLSLSVYISISLSLYIYIYICVYISLSLYMYIYIYTHPQSVASSEVAAPSYLQFANSESQRHKLGDAKQASHIS